jgi:colicin import membrane protein
MNRRAAHQLARMAWCLLLAAPAVQAQDADRLQLAAERAALQSRFEAQVKECQTRFAVTACVDDVRLRRREALAPVRARELQLDDAERSARAASREQALLAKQRDPLQPAPVVVQATPTPSATKARSQARIPPHEAAHKAANLGRAARAAERAKAAMARANAARAAQAEVAKRLSERAASGKASAPLPVPAASAAMPR